MVAFLYTIGVLVFVIRFKKCIIKAKLLDVRILNLQDSKTIFSQIMQRLNTL